MIRIELNTDNPLIVSALL
ncbi:hypothetical protein Godav_010647 [Gossypium davidsonii]|uniref:Uncharacterized protein n=1 Tax=Gossypium davidsonii TaxID=34287 RepID=A0A7J8SHA4_GOSDV|nr:hypothetical protein [Gossypium davidsonii]